MLSMDAKSLSEQNCPLAKRISLTLLLSYRPLLVRALWNPVGRRYDRPGDGRKHHCHAGPNRLFTRGGTTERSAVLISSLRSGLEVQFRFSKRGKTNTRSINWIKPKFWRPSPRAELPSLTVGILALLAATHVVHGLAVGRAIVCPENCQVNSFNS